MTNAQMTNLRNQIMYHRKNHRPGRASKCESCRVMVYSQEQVAGITAEQADKAFEEALMDEYVAEEVRTW
jgi:hypothetical protein